MSRRKNNKDVKAFEKLVQEEEKIQEQIDILQKLLRKKSWKIIRDLIEQWEREERQKGD